MLTTYCIIIIFQRYQRSIYSADRRLLQSTLRIFYAFKPERLIGKRPVSSQSYCKYLLFFVLKNVLYIFPVIK